MAMRASRTRIMKKKDLPKFDESAYAKVTLSNLIVYAVHYLIEQHIEIAMDDIVLACFRLFPHKFALKKYPRLPDSAVVSRHWHSCRSERYIAVNTDFGFKLTVKGERLARKTAKTLGVKISKPEIKAQKKITAVATSPQSKEIVEELKVAPKKNVTVPVEVKQAELAPTKPVEVPVKKAKVTPKKRITPPVEVKQVELPLTKPTEAPVKKVKVAPKKKEFPPVEAKQVELPLTKPVEAPIKKEKSAPKEKIVKQTQSDEPKPIWREKIIPPEPTVRMVNAQTEKANISVQGNVSAEAKVRAGKFVRMMETSDAYIQYKKSGEKSNISEFDFRSLLLCTMESSAETLARNVEQFKGYANIHNRHDIIAFLDFCGERFLYLLSPQKKMSAQRRNK